MFNRQLDQISILLRGKEPIRNYNKWLETFKSERPVRWFIWNYIFNPIETLHDNICDFFCRHWNYFANRFIERRHVVKLGKDHTERGHWYAMGHYAFHLPFQLLVDHVEIHCSKTYRNAGFFKSVFWPSNRMRNREEGLEFLKEESELVLDESWGVFPDSPNYGKPAHQAIIAKETIELYLWYKDVYPNRKDPYDFYCEGGEYVILSDELKKGLITQEQFRAKTKKLSAKVDRLEKQSFDEENKMLARLMKIRNYV